jgi:hypothetical protein
MGGHEREQFTTVSDNDCAGRIRYQYLSKLGDSNDLPVELLHRMATDIAGQCGHTLLKAHRVAWGWTVAQAVEAFHQMCRREHIKPRGLVARSWMDWETGSRPKLGLPGSAVPTVPHQPCPSGLGRGLHPW